MIPRKNYNKFVQSHCGLTVMPKRFRSDLEPLPCDQNKAMNLSKSENSQSNLSTDEASIGDVDEVITINPPKTMTKPYVNKMKKLNKMEHSPEKEFKITSVE